MISRHKFVLVLLIAVHICVLPVLADSTMTAAERYEQAEMLRKNSDPEAALAVLNRLRTDYPEDVDYAFARAQVLAQLQRDDEALTELEAATELAPDYEDVRRLRERLLARQLPEPRRWTLLLGAGYEDLTDGLPSWDNQFIEVHYEPKEDSRYFARLGRNARYSSADLSFGLGGERLLESGWFAGADLDLGNDPDYVPELGYSAHLGKAFADGWVTDLRYRRREYDAATVGSVIGTVEKYYGNYRFAYGLSWSRLHGASSFMNHVLTMNWYYRDDSSIGLTLNDGNEAESLGNGQVLETDVRGFSFSGRRAVNDRVAVQWWFGLHEQGDFYRRRFLGMAVSIGI